ncbi:MAG: hypothetical protein ACMUJM_14925 [bacterium]
MAQPEKTFKQGCCSASVFLNRISKNGKTMEMRSVALQKRYKDKDGNWQTTSNYGINELPKLILQ